MAVRDDFAPGEVLAAADLNDTFASKVDVTNGEVTTASTSSVVVRNIAVSTSDPSGGMDGDVWLKYTP